MKKIMFNDKHGLTAAVIRGGKTQTRRDATRLVEAYWNGRKLGDYPTLSLGEYVRQHAAYNVGDVVAVAQSYESAGFLPTGIVGKRTDAFGLLGIWAKDVPGWTNKMFVKAELMPHRIKITRVRLQLLQDISDEDCLREGIYYDKENGKSVGYPFAVSFYYTYRGAFNTKTGTMLHWTTPREAYASLIDKISGKGTWERNPYVLAYDFELVTNCHRLS